MKKLSFLTGDIAQYEGVDHVDMVVTLHAVIQRLIMRWKKP